MATENVKDFLGHPSKLARALERLDVDTAEARKLDQRELVRKIGILIDNLMDRAGYTFDALELARDTVEGVGDAEQAHALLAMAAPYQVDSCNMLGELGGHILAALEHADMMQANMVEAAHD